MTPKLARAVDPVFLHVLDLLDRIADQQDPSPQQERLRIVALIDQAEAIVGAGEEWELAKYALVSWIDEMLVETPWTGRDWWSNNVLEMEMFNTRLCSEKFYEKARQASSLTNRDALEVFYVCVVLGFRGLYRDENLAASFIQAYNLPPDLPAWAHQVSMSIRLGQGRPQLSDPGKEVDGAPPCGTKPWPSGRGSSPRCCWPATWSWPTRFLCSTPGDPRKCFPGAHGFRRLRANPPVNAANETECCCCLRGKGIDE